MKKIRFVLAMATVSLMAASCLKGGFDNTIQALDSFEYSDFLHQAEDSTYRSGFFVGNSGYFAYNIGIDADKKWASGFSLSAKVDKQLGKTYDKCSEFCALNTDPKSVAGIFALFYQNTDPALNPEKGRDIVYVKQTAASSEVKPNSLFVTNTNYVATLIRNGSDEFEPFKEGDYYRMVLTSYKESGEKVGQVSMDLATYMGELKLVTSWTRLETVALGDFEYVDIELQTNREGLPLYVCFDNVYNLVREYRID